MVYLYSTILRSLLCLKITVGKYALSVALLGFRKTANRKFGTPCIRTYQNCEQQAILPFVFLLKIILPTPALSLTSITLQNRSKAEFGAVGVNAKRKTEQLAPLYWTHYFLIYNNISQICGTEVDLASNTNEYQEYYLVGKNGRCVGLTNLAASCADFL